MPADLEPEQSIPQLASQVSPAMHRVLQLLHVVPGKEAKKYWDELLEGKYEWSSVAKLLRTKGLVPC